jgi:RecA-family ATPase
MADEFSAKSYDEHPPVREFLIDGGFALNSASILAAEGGTGKSFMFLDLAIKIAYGTIYQDKSFGGSIQQNGNVIYFSAEDGRPDIHERINLVDIGNPPRRFRKSPHELRIIPMPSLGVTFPLFYMKDGLLTESDQWSRIRESILEMDNVKLLIFDPLSMLVHADVNADPSMGSIVMAEFNRLAVETGAAVLISHHFSKGNYDIAIESPEQARQHVRGTTALVDSARNVFCIWKATESQARDSCAKLGKEYERNKIFMGATVKSNYLTQDALKVFERNSFTGVLTCVDDNYDSSRKDDARKSGNILRDEVRRIIEYKAEMGNPVKMKGPGSLSGETLEPQFQPLLRAKGAIEATIKDLIVHGEVFMNDADDGDRWKLDVPGGNYYDKWKEAGHITTY